MVTATLLWGATFVVIRDTLKLLDPVPLVLVRFGAAAVMLGVILAVRGRIPSRAAWAGGAISGVLGALGYAFQAIGLTATSAGSSAFLTCAGTLFAGFFAWPLLGQRPGPVLIGGIALAMLGAALMASRADLRLGVGEAWTLVGALAYALQIVVVARYAPRVDPVAMVGVQAAATAIILSPFAAAAVRELAVLPGAGWWRLAYLVVAASVTAPLLQVMAQRTLSAGRIGLMFALEPVFALVFASTLGGERFALRWWLGAALILTAVLGVELEAVRRAPADSR
jgi:drug/metabolite transporter (DMT)-like permease